MNRTAVRGAAAGAVGVWAMDLVTWALYRREAPARVAQEVGARMFGKDTAHAAAHHLSRMLGREPREEPNAGGLAIHYLLGIVPGMAYAVMRRRAPVVSAGLGSMWGGLLFVANDELAAPALRLAGPPQAYPWQAHVRGLVGHVVLGVVTHLVLDAIEEAPPGR